MSSIVTPDFVAGVYTNYRSEFNEYYAAALKEFPLADLVTEVPSTKDTEDYSWLGDLPAVREFVGERVYKGIAVHNYSIKNKTWENTIAIDADTFEDTNQVVQIRPRVQDLAASIVRHKFSLLTTLIEANGTVYDGQALYSNSHSSGESGTQDNLLSGAGTSVANLKTDMIAAKAALRKFKTDTGEYVNAGMNLVVMAPPALEGVFDEFLNATIISQTTNIFKGAAKLIINPYLTDANDWYLFNVVGPIKALIFQMREQPSLTAITSPQSDHVFKYNEYLWGTKARYNAGFGLWQLTCKVVNT